MLCRNVAIIDQGNIVENTSVKSLLKTLNREVFVLDTREALTEAPRVANYELRLAEDHCLEVEVEKGRSLNDLFAELTQAGVNVVSMRNKTNRLEELFVSRIRRQQADNEESAA